MIYNFNLGIGWASSGVEYAQAYRANILRRINQPAKFIFTDMFTRDNLQEMTANIGFKDEEVMWLYTFFSDVKISPTTYTLEDLKRSIGDREYTFTQEGNIARFVFEGSGNFFTAYMSEHNPDKVHRVEMVSRGNLIRKDYYTYCRIYSEYYIPRDGKAYIYQRRYFNEDGTVCYDEMVEGDKVFYRFPDRVLYSKEEFVGYMVSKMGLTADDIVIIDRTTGIGQAIMENAGPAKIGIVIHADHFSEGGTNDDYILWNNYYEYAFSQHKKISFFITATDAQNTLLREQFRKYYNSDINVFTIPVGSLDELKYPDKERSRHSFITASRLATEKHLDWLIAAVAEAHEAVPDITLDIYGKGGEENTLKKTIEQWKAQEYIHMMGQQNLTEIYKNYQGYLSASTSEGFGLTLLEAVGSGLPIIGFDVRYGNQCFIDEGLNGYRIGINDKMSNKEKAHLLSEAIVRLCTQADMEAFCNHSYEIAKGYLTEEVEKKWANLIKTTL